MPSIEVLRNGKRLYVAGHEKAESLQVSLYYSGESRQPEVQGFAVVAQTPDLREHFLWKSEVGVGDTVELRIANDLTPDPAQPAGTYGKRVSGDTTEMFCSFCGKSQHQVEHLIAGPGVFICDDCIDVCNDVINAKQHGAPDKAP